jgi:hypothetical protein
MAMAPRMVVAHEILPHVSRRLVSSCLSCLVPSVSSALFVVHSPTCAQIATLARAYGFRRFCPLRALPLLLLLAWLIFTPAQHDARASSWAKAAQRRLQPIVPAATHSPCQRLFDRHSRAPPPTHSVVVVVAHRPLPRHIHRTTFDAFQRLLDNMGTPRAGVWPV